MSRQGFALKSGTRAALPKKWFDGVKRCWFTLRRRSKNKLKKSRRWRLKVGILCGLLIPEPAKKCRSAGALLLRTPLAS
jgi:hypothetical protein